MGTNQKLIQILQSVLNTEECWHFLNYTIDSYLFMNKVGIPEIHEIFFKCIMFES